jgi:hypothetical protein
MKLGRMIVATAVLALAAGGVVVAVGAATDRIDLNDVNLNRVSNNQPAKPAGKEAGQDAKPATKDGGKPDAKPAAKEVHTHLVFSSDAIKRCLPYAKVNITVLLQTDAKGRDVFKVDASGLKPNTSFTTFLLEVPASPFGAAEYIGDVDTDKYGRAHAEFELIVEEAFASTLVDGKRVRAELNHIGMWFADPADDDICFGKGGGAVTPFDGDNEAGVQAFNSANSLPGAPLP